MLELILETGEMPDVEDIIERAEISRRSFFRYFNSESERIQEINQLLISKISSELEVPQPDQTRTLVETLELFVYAKTQFDEFRMPLRKLTEMKMNSSPELRQYIEKRRQLWCKQIEGLFLPHLEERADKEILFQHIHFNTTWNVWASLRNDFKMSVEDSRHFIKRQILAVLGS